MFKTMRQPNWTEEEIQALRRVIQHQSSEYGSDAGSRKLFWEQVTRYVNGKSGTTRTVAQVKAKVNNLKRKRNNLLLLPFDKNKTSTKQQNKSCFPRKTSRIRSTSQRGLKGDNNSDEDKTLNGKFINLDEIGSPSGSEIIDVETMDEPAIKDGTNNSCQNRSSEEDKSSEKNTNEIFHRKQQPLPVTIFCKRLPETVGLDRNESFKISRNYFEPHQNVANSAPSIYDKKEVFQRLHSASENVRSLTKAFVGINTVIDRIANALEEHKRLKKQKLNVCAETYECNRLE